MGLLTPRLDLAIEFLRAWAPDSFWVLTSIESSTQRRGITTKTFDAKTEGECRAWLAAQVEVQRNIYFHVNPTMERLEKKAEREDIAALAWLHLDIDPRAGEPIAEEQERILALFRENLPPSIPPPTGVVFSGGGYQGFWKLAEPMRLDGDVARCEEAKRFNLQLEVTFGADACHNVDRIMRLPGTINWPDERKRKKGREPALAKVVEWHAERVYNLGDFTPAAPVQSPATTKGFSGGSGAERVKVSGNVARLASVEDLGPKVSDLCKAVVQVGHDPDNPGKFSSRSEWLWFVVCELVRSGVSDTTIYSVITDESFGISGHILDQDNPHASAVRQIERAREHAIHPKLRELNERHAVISDIGGRCRIVSEVEDGVVHRRSRLSFQSAADFKLRYMNQRIEYVNAAGNPVSQRLGDWWLRHPNRRQFDTIVFAPGMVVEGSYNLWKGFAYNARPGECGRFLAHVRDNVCAGHEDHYAYLLGWMASAVQKPASPGHTAVVLRGTQGTGKSFFSKTFGRLFGRHFLQVSDPKHLVGSFNAHLRDCVVLFGDEAFYAGDKKHEGVLKMLVTEEMITIEAKGVDAVASPNFTHLIMASNEKWVVPAGFHERRFFVLDVTTSRRQDSAYFGAIQGELDDGGFEALLYFLRTYDLSNFDVRKLPQTEGLAEQKVLSYKNDEDWWYQKLVMGEIIQGWGWPEYVYSAALIEDYVVHSRSFGVVSNRGTATRLGLFLKQCVPDGWQAIGQIYGKHVFQVNGREFTLERPRVRPLPSLGVCRRVWNERFGGPTTWPEIHEHPAQGATLPIDGEF